MTRFVWDLTGRLSVVFGCLSFAAAFILSWSNDICADNIHPRPRVIVAPEASVRGEVITLGDIARIYNDEPGYEALVGQLKRIKLLDSPPPRTNTTILGANILSAISSAGIPLDAIGYSVPQTIVVQREGRIITTGEVLSAVRQRIAQNKTLDIQVREVEWNNSQLVPAGPSQITVEPLGAPTSGKIPLRVEVSVEDKPAARFLATAIADDWREVPVLNRTVERGMLIVPDDIQLVRLNLFKQPADIADSADSLVGKRVKNTIGAGETVRKSFLDIPPTIPRGQRVKLRYENGGLVAVATGIAMEDGFDGAPVKVRNESSKKIVAGLVNGAEEVIVK